MILSKKFLFSFIHANNSGLEKPGGLLNIQKIDLSSFKTLQEEDYFILSSIEHPLLNSINCFDSIIINKSSIKAELQHQKGFLFAQEIKSITISSSKLYGNRFFNLNSTFILIHNIYNQSIISITECLISFNRVVFGGLMSVIWGKNLTEFSFFLSNNSILSNTASLKGAIFYFKIGDVKNFGMKEILKNLAFKFQHNTISRNKASQGLIAYFEGLAASNHSEEILERMRINTPNIPIHQQKNLIVLKQSDSL